AAARVERARGCEAGLVNERTGPRAPSLASVLRANSNRVDCVTGRSGRHNVVYFRRTLCDKRTAHGGELSGQTESDVLAPGRTKGPCRDPICANAESKTWHAPLIREEAHHVDLDEKMPASVRLRNTVRRRSIGL